MKLTTTLAALLGLFIGIGIANPVPAAEADIAARLDKRQCADIGRQCSRIRNSRIVSLFDFQKPVTATARAAAADAFALSHRTSVRGLALALKSEKQSMGSIARGKDLDISFNKNVSLLAIL